MLKRLTSPAALLALACLAPALTAAQNQKPAAPPPEEDEVNVRVLTRSKIFTSTAEQLGLKGADAEAKVWGVIMEVADPDGSPNATLLLSLRDGNARITTTSTDGLAYGGYVARAEVRKFLAEGEKYLPRMKPTKVFPPPERGRIRVYLLTRDGVYTTEADREAAGTRGHPLFPLSLAAYQVLIKVQDGAAKLRPRGQQ